MACDKNMKLLNFAKNKYSKVDYFAGNFFKLAVGIC